METKWRRAGRSFTVGGGFQSQGGGGGGFSFATRNQILEVKLWEGGLNLRLRWDKRAQTLLGAIRQFTSGAAAEHSQPRAPAGRKCIKAPDLRL